MRVGIDARALLTQRTGIGVYTENIARALGERERMEIDLFTPREVSPRPEFPPSVRFVPDAHKFGTVWIQTHLPRRLDQAGSEVLLSALTISPTRISIPSVSVVHDLTPLSHPEWHRRKVVVAFLPWIEKTLDRAARVIAVSETTARDLKERFPEVSARVTVVPHGVQARFRPPADAAEAESTRAEYTRSRRYVLYLGTLEPRKNLVRLLSACERLWREKRSRPDLLLAGGAGWRSAPLLERIARSPFRDKIHRVGYVDPEDAPRLYGAADVFCYPSHEEGFGLPVLEAMACGAPAVISTTPALMETAGGAALSAPAGDDAALAEAIARVLEEPNLRDTLVSRGLARAAGFRWEESARRTADVLRLAREER
ncbi:MAG: glycosyltransferase family 4 protein [Thermoanaerobaculia bacterium]